MQVGESVLMSQAYHQPSTLEEVRTLWIGDLQYWVDESYLHSCFAHTGEVISIKIIRNKLTGQPEGYGFVEFVSHGAAERILQAYNGGQMPGTEQTFRLNWASFGIGEKRPDAGPEHSIFVGDLSPDVTDYLLQETFRVQYPSVRAAKVVTDTGTGRSKGYGFVKFADETERNRAMAEMNGVYCSTRPMRISAATPKKTTAVVVLGLQQPALPKAPATPPAQPVPADADTSNATDPEDELKQKQAARLSWGGPKDAGAGWAEQPDGAAAAAAAVAGQWSAYYAAAAAAYGGQQGTAAAADSSSYAAAYDSSALYAYGPYAGYVQQQHYQNPHQVDAVLDSSTAVMMGMDQPKAAEPYDPLATPDVDKLNAIYIGIHGGAILGRPMWQRTSPSLTQHN